MANFITNMKSSLFIIGMLCGIILMTSCTTTRRTISPQTYLGEIDKVNESIESMGYKLSGTSSDQKNEVYVSAVSYSTQTGYGSAMDNDYYWYDTYRFNDSTNNTVSYQVKYKYAKDDKGKTYVSNVSVTGCDCSNKKDYSNICGRNGVTYFLNYIINDQNSTFDNHSGTYALVGSILLAVETVVLLILISNSSSYHY